MFFSIVIVYASTTGPVYASTMGPLYADADSKFLKSETYSRPYSEGARRAVFAHESGGRY